MSLQACQFCTFHIKGNIQCVLFVTDFFFSACFQGPFMLQHVSILPSCSLLLLLLSCFSCVRFCATPQTAAHQAPLSLGFSSQEHWSGLPLPSPPCSLPNNILLYRQGQRPPGSLISFFLLSLYQLGSRPTQTHLMRTCSSFFFMYSLGGALPSTHKQMSLTSTSPSHTLHSL